MGKLQRIDNRNGKDTTPPVNQGGWQKTHVEIEPNFGESIIPINGLSERFVSPDIRWQFETS